MKPQSPCSICSRMCCSEVSLVRHLSSPKPQSQLISRKYRAKRANALADYIRREQSPAALFASLLHIALWLTYCFGSVRIQRFRGTSLHSELGRRWQAAGPQ